MAAGTSSWAERDEEKEALALGNTIEMLRMHSRTHGEEQQVTVRRKRGGKRAAKRMNQVIVLNLHSEAGTSRRTIPIPRYDAHTRTRTHTHAHTHSLDVCSHGKTAGEQAARRASVVPPHKPRAHRARSVPGRVESAAAAAARASARMATLPASGQLGVPPSILHALETSDVQQWSLPDRRRRCHRPQVTHHHRRPRRRRRSRHRPFARLRLHRRR
jgi:hypothetical protein